MLPLSLQFYLSESDIGKPRDQCSAPKLALLNQYVPVTVHEGEFHIQHLANFQVNHLYYFACVVSSAFSSSKDL